MQLLTRRFSYIVDLTNWMEWSIYVLALVFVWHDIEDFIDADMGLVFIRFRFQYALQIKS